jgi:hypothetical protein
VGFRRRRRRRQRVQHGESKSNEDARRRRPGRTDSAGRTPALAGDGRREVCRSQALETIQRVLLIRPASRLPYRAKRGATSSACGCELVLSCVLRSPRAFVSNLSVRSVPSIGYNDPHHQDEHHHRQRHHHHGQHPAGEPVTIAGTVNGDVLRRTTTSRSRRVRVEEPSRRAASPSGPIDGTADRARNGPQQSAAVKGDARAEALASKTARRSMARSNPRKPMPR